MPYKLRKAPKRDLFWVVGEDGSHKSKDPLPLERAKAQMRALYASMKKEGGMKPQHSKIKDISGMRGGRSLKHIKEYFKHYFTQIREETKENMRRRIRAEGQGFATEQEEDRYIENQLRGLDSAKRIGYSMLADLEERSPPLGPDNYDLLQRSLALHLLEQMLTGNQDAPEDGVAYRIRRMIETTTGEMGDIDRSYLSAMEREIVDMNNHDYKEAKTLTLPIPFSEDKLKISAYPKPTKKEEPPSSFTQENPLRRASLLRSGMPTVEDSDSDESTVSNVSSVSAEDPSGAGKAKYRGCGALPPKNILHKIAEQSYQSNPAQNVDGWNLVFQNPTLKIYNNGNTMIVGIRGTVPTDTGDLKADASIAIGQLASSNRYNSDVNTMREFQKTHSPSQFDYYGVGHSLGGAILDLFIKNGIVKNGVSYNPAVQPQDLNSTSTLNDRVYVSTDPLYQTLGRQLAVKPEVRQKQVPWYEKLVSYVPWAGTAFSLYKAHTLDNFEGGRKLRGGFNKDYVDAVLQDMFEGLNKDNWTREDINNFLGRLGFTTEESRKIWYEGSPTIPNSKIPERFIAKAIDNENKKSNKKQKTEEKTEGSGKRGKRGQPNRKPSETADLVRLLNSKTPWTINKMYSKAQIKKIQNTAGVPPSMITKLDMALTGGGLVGGVSLQQLRHFRNFLDEANDNLIPAPQIIQMRNTLQHIVEELGGDFIHYLQNGGGEMSFAMFQNTVQRTHNADPNIAIEALDNLIVVILEYIQNEIQMLEEEEEEVEEHNTGGGKVSDSVAPVAPAKFARQLEKAGIGSSAYLNEARGRAKAHGYPYKLLGFASDGDHKLAIPDENGRVVSFGKVGYGDHIIYSHMEGTQSVPKGTADAKKRAFHNSHSKIRGNWRNNPFSANNLALKILW